MRLESKQELIRERWKSVLNAIINEVQRAKEVEQKIEIATRKISKEAIKKADKSFSVEKIIQTKPEDKFDETNGLAIAICSANVDACHRLFKHIDEAAINNSENFVWGYRQPFSFLHLALAPREHLRDLFSLEPAEDFTKSFSQIIELLIEKKADPNVIGPYIGIGFYNNPPMSAGLCCGREIFKDESLVKLRAQLVLGGSGP